MTGRTPRRVVLWRKLGRSARKSLARALAPVLAEVPQLHRVAGPKDRVQLHPTCQVNDAFFNTRGGRITVGRYAFFGHQVMVLTGRHDIQQTGPDRQQAVPREGYDVTIEEGAWVASRAIVIGPCVIGAHAVIAAGSVVTSSVPPRAIAAGSPARVIGWVDEEPIGRDS